MSEMEEERRKEEKRKDRRSTSEETGRGEKKRRQERAVAEEENRKKMKEIMHDCMIAERTVSNCTYRASSSSFKSALLLCSASMSSISLPPPSPAMLNEEQNTKNYREVMKIKRKEVIFYSIIDFL